jgi:NitT/TauT family transport system ATP-binding protein
VALSDRVVVMTARPGTVKASIVVPFKRPRIVEDLMHDVAAMELRSELWHLVKEEVRKAAHAPDRL